MAGSVNKVIILGRLGKDPEVRTLNNGDRIANLNVATSENWRDKMSGERKEKTEWHRVVIFNDNLAKIAEQYLRKGANVYLEGQLQTRKWTAQDGTDRYATEIVLQRFKGELTLLDKASNGPPPADSQDDYGHHKAYDPNSQYTGGIDNRGRDSGRDSFDLDDEIPF